MKILIIQENGRHEENKNYRECFCLQRSFNKLGFESFVWGLGHKDFDDVINFNKFDLIINLENYDETDWLPDLSKFNNPVKFLWVIDAHVRGMKPYYKIFSQGKYNLILQAIKDYVDDKSVWIPNCYDSSLIKPLDIEKKYDLGFCGSVLNRATHLEFLEKEFNLKKDVWVLGDAMVRTINSYKIHFNLNISNDVNYRCFETMGCGTVLLTDYNTQYGELGFKDGVNCIIYKNIDKNIFDLRNKINYYLKPRKVINPNKISLDEIAENGLELVKKHTYDERAKKIISLFKDIKTAFQG